MKDLAGRREWKMRPIRAGTQDRAKILELFEIVFGHQMDAALWNWQFLDNPFSRAIVHLAETPEGRLVGHHSLIPLPFLKEGARGLAALSIQSMIHPDFQRRGILKGLAAAAERELEADGIRTALTFLNDNSLHAYTQHFGWTELGGPNFIFFTVLDCKGPLTKILRHEGLASVAALLANPPARLVFRGGAQATGPYAIAQVKRFDDRVDALWRSFSRDLRFSTDRTASYLNWRVVDRPGDYSRFIAEDGDRLVGLVVTKTERKFGLHFGYIAELVFDPAHPAGRQLLAYALEHLRKQGCSMASAVCSGSELMLRTLRSGGFWRLPRKAMPHGIHFCHRERGPASAADGWYLSWTDHDVV